ncbi:uncharacterized protein Dmoj_GI26367 [Drosophila mojavensis]|uniref:Uncharacterized protein n=1 Tax=Drosophila mojavensis TaxID=7230 RepID=A0A0Q9X4Y0_DROMO|nr:uncharacterized protein Dmoj_GI26367 [Drosophila mojavensis]
MGRANLILHILVAGCGFQWTRSIILRAMKLWYRRLNDYNFSHEYAPLYPSKFIYWMCSHGTPKSLSPNRNGSAFIAGQHNERIQFAKLASLKSII